MKSVEPKSPEQVSSTPYASPLPMDRVLKLVAPDWSAKFQPVYDVDPKIAEEVMREDLGAMAGWEELTQMDPAKVGWAGMMKAAITPVIDAAKQGARRLPIGKQGATPETAMAASLSQDSLDRIRKVQGALKQGWAQTETKIVTGAASVSVALSA